MNTVRTLCSLHAFALAVLMTSVALAQAPVDGDALPPQQIESSAGDDPHGFALPEIAVDYGFDRIVRLVDLVDVINARDSKALADIALLTKSAEDILKRSHSSGVDSKALLQLASQLAAQQEDEETLTRLTAAGIARPESVAPEVQPFEVPATTAPEVVELFQGLRDEIKTGILLSDAARLTRVRDVVDSEEKLSEAMKTHLNEMSSAASANIQTDAEASSLQNLLAEIQASASVIYYQHSWGGGATYTIYGLYQRSNMPSGWNDVVSSVWVRRGYLLYSYEHVNYSGARCWVLVERDGSPGSSPGRSKTPEQAGWLFEMSSHGWNDVISSFKITSR